LQTQSRHGRLFVVFDIPVDKLDSLVVITGVCVDVLLFLGVMEIVDDEEIEVGFVTEVVDVEVELVSVVVDKDVDVIEELHGLQ